MLACLLTLIKPVVQDLPTPVLQPDAAVQAQIQEAMLSRLNQERDGWFGEGDYPAVTHNLEYVVRWTPNDYERVTDLGWMYSNMRQFDRELSVYVRFRQNNPEMADAPFPEANFLYRRDAFARVIALLRPTIDMEPKPHPNNYRMLAQSYEKMGLLQEAVKVYDALLAYVPEDATSARNRDRILNLLKQQSTSGG